MKNTLKNNKENNKNIYNRHEGVMELLIKNAIFVRDNHCLTKVKFSDILYLKGDGSYTVLVTRQKEFSLRNILKEFEGILPEDQFIRIHKSFIVRIEEILTISPKEVMVDTEKLPVGRMFYPKLINGVLKLSSNNGRD